MVKFDIAKCGMCGKAFIGVSGMRSVCENCRDEEQVLYKKLREIIRDNPEKQLTISDAVSMLKVDERKIHHLVDSGLVQLVKSQKFLRLFNESGGGFSRPQKGF
jgi:DNA replication initiation complex subunit (GINS family)